jgi:hypothetical protein
MRPLLALLLVILLAACGDGSPIGAGSDESDGSSTSTSTRDEPDSPTIGSEEPDQPTPVGEVTDNEELLEAELVNAELVNAELLNEVRAARARWEAAAVTDYTISYQPVCFCPQTLLSGIVVNGVRDRRGWLDVEMMFDQLETALRDGVASFSAEYDPTLGYPTDYYIDFDRMTADEEFGVASVVVVATS